MKTARPYVFIFVSISADSGARASRVLVAASRRNTLSLRFQRVGDFALSEKFAMASTPSLPQARDETYAVPSQLLWTWFVYNPHPLQSHRD